MKPLILFVAMAALCTGCANPAHTYASRHPELSPAHREILHRGRIPSGTAVAGMTQEQVRLAMGGEPTSQDRIDGKEAWIYERKKLIATEFSGLEDPYARSAVGRGEATGAADNVGRQADAVVKTTVFFEGERATHAAISDERP